MNMLHDQLRAHSPLTKRCLLVLIGALLLASNLPALETKTGIYAGATAGFGVYFQDLTKFQRYDVLGGRETNLMPAFNFSTGFGAVLGYRTEISAFELCFFEPQETNNEITYEPIDVDGTPYYVWKPSLPEVGTTGKFFVTDRYRSVHPFVAFSLLFRCLTVSDASIDRTSHTQSDVVFLGYGYAMAVGADLSIFPRIWVTFTVAYGWHRYMWVRGALGETSALADPISGSGIIFSFTAAALLWEIPRGSR